MTLHLYDLSVPVFLRGFANLGHILDKGEAHAREAGTAPAAMIEARLAPDMLNLAGQVQRASDAAKSCASRLAGVEIPSFADEETTFAELHGRIGRTVAFLEGLDRAAFDGAESRPVTLNIRRAPVTMDGQSLLMRFSLPNFFFHVTTAYAIARHQGVALVKLDYLGDFPPGA